LNLQDVGQSRPIRYFDVAVTNPASLSNLSNRGRDFLPLHGAKNVEDSKTRKYVTKYNPANGFHNFSFTPIVIETTGALGPSAHSLIMELSGLNGLIPIPDEQVAAARKRLLIRISVICARAKHQMVTFFQRFVQQQVNSQQYGPVPNRIYGSQESNLSVQDPSPIVPVPFVPQVFPAFSTQDSTSSSQDPQLSQDSFLAPILTPALAQDAQDQDHSLAEHAFDL
jgi:hypothetical protein